MGTGNERNRGGEGERKNCRAVENSMVELAPVSRNNAENEPSSRQSILRYFRSSIPCVASTLRHRYH